MAELKRPTSGKPVYVVARTASKRPSLMHVIQTNDWSTTECGVNMGEWSRSYHDTPIMAILCYKCGRDMRST